MRPKDQGTAWETELVRRAQNAGLLADRLPEAGGKDLGDVWLLDTPNTGKTRVALAWKRLTGDGQRRTPDGERDVIVIPTDHYLELLTYAPEYPYSVVVECKATQALNVTRVLGKARRKGER